MRSRPASTRTVRQRGGTLRLQCQAVGDSELEMWGVPRRAELLESVLGVKVRTEVVQPEPAAEAVPVVSGVREGG